MNARPESPIRVFIALCAIAAVALTAAVYWAKNRGAGDPSPTGGPGAVLQSASAPVPASAGPAQQVQADSPEDLPPAPEQGAVPVVAAAKPQVKFPRIFFRYTGIDSNYGKLAYVDDPKGPLQFAEPLACEVAYVGGGKGICLTAKRGVVTTYAGKLFDANTFVTLADFPLQGVPSRNRVSVDGSVAAYTAFLSGHGYSSLDFTTQAVLIDVASGNIIADLEKDFVVKRDGQVITEQDFNFWGVTFTPDVRGFYATLSTGGKHYLVKGDIAGRTMSVIHENVECPSLSPDGTRVAYKKRFLIDDRIVWQLHVLDVASGKETPLGEKRSIDDQLEWLDNGRVLYSVPEGDGTSGGGTDVWVVPVNGKGEPQLFLRKAYSPSVAR